jgi:hypothetical protein
MLDEQRDMTACFRQALPPGRICVFSGINADVLQDKLKQVLEKGND